jgi:glucose-6-phosphate 1-dehydrogenase
MKGYLHERSQTKFKTEAFAALKVMVINKRWKGVPF